MSDKELAARLAEITELPEAEYLVAREALIMDKMMSEITADVD